MTAVAHAPDRFKLVKWYLDAVEADGTATIAYWASLAWLGMEVAWHDVSRYVPGQPPLERSSMRRVPPPAVADRHIAWQSDRLGLASLHEAAAPAITVTLLDDAHGRITWDCIAPSARARFESAGAMTEGTGYVERITMTVPPWQLPIDELRWGRWMSDDAASSLVWIDWRGALPVRWVVCNGAVHEAASVRDDGIDLDAGRLTLHTPRTLHDRSVGRLLRGISGLTRLAARIPLSWEEHKWCSRATWTSIAGESVSGWAIHEMVTLT